MRASDFIEGAKVTSPYAGGDHYCLDVAHVRPGNIGGSVPMAHQIGTVGPVDSDGWADISYPDGYTVSLNAERCNSYTAGV